MRTPLERLGDARVYARQAVVDASGLDPEVLAEAKQPLHAALYDLLVVGAALGKLPDEWRSLTPDILWIAIGGLRNRIAHASWQIDLTIVADMIAHRIQPLIDAIDRLAETVKRAEA